MNTPQFYRLESDYPFAGVGQVHSEKEWLRIYGYAVGCAYNRMKFVPVSAEGNFPAVREGHAHGKTRPHAAVIAAFPEEQVKLRIEVEQLIMEQDEVKVQSNISFPASNLEGAATLLPCPFCGAEAVINEHNKRIAINCKNHECWAQQKGLKSDFQLLVSAWNSRQVIDVEPSVTEAARECAKAETIHQMEMILTLLRTSDAEELRRHKAALAVTRDALDYIAREPHSSFVHKWSQNALAAIYKELKP